MYEYVAAFTVVFRLINHPGTGCTFYMYSYWRNENNFDF